MNIYRRTKHPCFGKSSGLTSRDWWWQVVEATYLRTQHNTALEPEEFAQVLPAVFDMLYKDIFGTQKGWVVKEDVVYTLSKLQQWRDVGAGPQLAVISNCDERLHNILKGNALANIHRITHSDENMIKRIVFHRARPLAVF